MESTSPAPSPRSLLLFSPLFSRYHYGPSHPLKNERLTLTFRLIQAYGLDRLERAQVREPRPAEEAEALLFHHAKYLEVLRKAEEGKPFPNSYSYGLGTPDNPIFPGVYTWSLLVAGASLSAARALEEGFDFAFNPAGGLHHAHAAKASGFCYVNDPAVMIRDLLKRGRRVAYLDLDAHHGDGVQEAFYETDQVLTISLHESGHTLFPGTGFTQEMGRGKGKGYAVNLPFHVGTDDEIFLWAFEEIALPLISSFKPDVLVTQLGVDTHRSDPLSNLALTIQGFAEAVSRVRRMAGKWIALGGGGYDLDNVPRAWTLVWAIMNDQDLDPNIPEEFLDFARAMGFAEDFLWDPPVVQDDSLKERAARFAQEQVESIKKIIFPIHGMKG